MQKSALSQPGVSELAVQFCPRKFGQLRYQAGHVGLNVCKFAVTQFCFLNRLDLGEEFALMQSL